MVFYFTDKTSIFSFLIIWFRQEEHYFLSVDNLNYELKANLIVAIKFYYDSSSCAESA